LFNKIKPEYIIHLATRGIYSYQWDEPARVLINNFSMTVNLLETSKQYSRFIKGFVSVGSTFEYGTKKGEMKESEVTDINLTGLYALSKRTTSILMDSFKDFFPIIMLRIATVYGPFNDSTKFIEGSILNFFKLDSINVAKGVIKDFIYIEDVVSALLLGAESAKKLRGEVINIGSGKGYKLERVIEIVKTKMIDHDMAGKIIISSKFRRSSETMSWTDIKKAEKLLKWKPKYTLSQGLDLTIQWYKKNWQSLPKSKL
jgi:nucleoside-diphosphate-sugar epimerase